MADNAQGVKAGRAYVSLGVEMSGLKKGLNDAAGYLKAWGVGITAMAATVSAAGGALGGALLEATNVLRDQSAELLRANQLTGMNAERLSAMGYAAVQLGGDLEDVTQGMAHMARFLREVREGSSSANDTLRILRITAGELVNLDLESAYYRLGSATNQVANSTDRLIAARNILGRHGVGTLGVFGAGREQFENLMAQGRASGQVMSKEDVATGVLLNRQWQQMLGSLKAIAVQIGVGMAPQWEFLLNLIKGGAEILTRFVKTNRDLVPWLDRLATGLTIGGGAMTALGVALMVVGASMRGWYPILSAAGAAISGLARGAGALGAVLAGPLIAGVRLTLLAVGQALSAIGGAMLAVAGAAVAPFVGAVTSAWASLTGFVASAIASASSLLTLSGITSAASAAWAMLTGSTTAGTVGMTGASASSAGLMATLTGVVSIATGAWAILGNLGAVLIAVATVATTADGPFAALTGILAALGIVSGGDAFPALVGLGAIIGVVTTALVPFAVALQVAIASLVVLGPVVLPLIPVFVTLAVVLAPLAATLLAVAASAAITVGWLAVLGAAIAMVPVALVAALGAVMLILGAISAAVFAGAMTMLLFGQTLVEAFQSAWQAITEAIGTAWDAIKETAGAVWDWIADRSAAVWQGIKSVAGTAWTWIIDTGKGAWDAIASAASSAWQRIAAFASQLGDIFGSIMDSIQTGNLSDALEVGWAAIRLGWVQVTNFLEIQWLTWRNAILDIAEGLWLRLREMWHGGAFSLSNIWRGLGNMVRTSWTAVTTWLQARWADVMDFIGGGNSAAPLQAAAEEAQAAAEAAQNAPTFDAAAERRRHEENVAARQRELDEARARGPQAEEEARAALDMAQWLALVNSVNSQNSQAGLRARLEQQLGGQTGPGVLYGSAVHGTFSGAALEGLNIGGRSNVQQDIADRTQEAVRVQEQMRDAIQRIADAVGRAGLVKIG